MSEFGKYNLVPDGPITCYAFNQERTHVVLCSNTNKAYIYANMGSKWELEHCLDEHDLRVMAVDWGMKRGRIVTCSEDTNAYVWRYTADKKEWKPDLVHLRMNRSAVCVKFDHSENKLAVGTGAKLIAVCYYDESNDWWISKHIKKNICGTVSCISWHPSGKLLAASSSDMHIYVFSAAIKSVDTSDKPSSWGDNNTFGDLLYCYQSNSRAWAHSISFSPSGDAVAWTSHDSTISYVASSQKDPITESSKSLPFLSLVFVSEDMIIASGFDQLLFLYAVSGKKLSLAGKIGEELETESKGGTTAFKMFKMLDNIGQEVNIANISERTLHKKKINQLAAFKTAENKVTHISSADDDGTLIIWKVPKY